MYAWTMSVIRTAAVVACLVLAATGFVHRSRAEAEPPAASRQAVAFPGPSAPLYLAPGPYLFIDDYLVDSSENITRKVQQPVRELSRPVVTSLPGEQAAQPFVGVIYDPADNRFRMWYNASRNPEEEAESYWGPGLAYRESTDGVNWATPLKRLTLPLTTGATVIDMGSSFTPASERYKLVYRYTATNKSGDYIKVRIAFSPNGLNWTWYRPIDTLFPGHGTDVNGSNQWGDATASYYDPIRNQYGLFSHFFGPYTWKNKEGVTQTATIRRVHFLSSTDHKTWTNTASPTVMF